MEIIVKTQRQMNLRETLDFCASSIRHRFSRSLLTLSVVILAVTFFMYLRCSTVFRSEIRKSIRTEVRQSRAGAKLASLLFAPYSRADFIRMIAECDDEMLHRLGQYFGWDEKEAGELRHSAASIVLLETCFSELPPGKLQMLLEDTAGSTELERFCSADASDIIRKSRALGIRLPLETEDVRSFIAAYPAARRKLPQAEKQWGAFQQDLRHFAGIRTSGSAIHAGRTWLLNLPETERAALRKFLADRKFVPDETHWRSMLEYLRIQHVREQIAAYLAKPEVRREWRGVFGGGAYVRLDEKLSILDREECRRFAGPLTDAERSDVARATRERVKLNALQESFAASEKSGEAEDHSRQIYLMTLAFLVCVIGITNAMLMSITERFSEIATLKCLGATDSFILVQIVLEALLHGVIGGVAGVIIGLLAASAANIVSAGSRFFGVWNFPALGNAALWSLFAGIILAILSAIYPAVKAARMAPMEAMRVQ